MKFDKSCWAICLVSIILRYEPEYAYKKIRVSVFFFSIFISLDLCVAEKRTVCLEEVRKLKNVKSDEFLNNVDPSQPCNATVAVTGMFLFVFSLCLIFSCFFALDNCLFERNGCFCHQYPNDYTNLHVEN